MKFSAIILAGGKGERFGSSIPKPFMSLNGKAVIQYSLDIIEPLVNEIIIVSNKKYKDYKCVKGGKTRSESVLNGLKEVKSDYVIVHDAARPFITTNQITEIKDYLIRGCCVVDTQADIIDGYIEDNIPKDKKGRKLGLTPEGFRVDVLKRAFKLSDKDYQDEVTMLYDIYGFIPDVVKGTTFNSKITFEKDLAYAEGIMKFWQEPINTTSDLKKKTLVLGGTGGIGKACLKQLKNGYFFTRKELDLSKEFDIDLSEYEAIIHSAGEYHDESKIMAVNFDSCVRLIKLAEEQNWTGNIVFLSSTASTYGRKGIPIYCASKSALNLYIESRAEELAEKGIYINAIAPAKVDTKLQKAINPDTPKSEMITPKYVADYVLRYIDTDVYGHIIYLRKGLDK